MPFLEAEAPPPRYAPVDEEHYPLPTTTYALSRIASETIAGHIAQWAGIPFVALRFSNIMGPGDYREFPSLWADPHARKWNLWGYVDVRDVAGACCLALEAATEAVAGSPAFIIAAADTVMNRPSAELLAEVFPKCPADPRGRGIRDAASDRPCPEGARLPAAILLARSHIGCSRTYPRGCSQPR